jgi:hypothetical protein
MSFDRGSSLTALHLCCSSFLRPEYDGFLASLEGQLDQPTVTATGSRQIDAALKVLQREREGEGENAVEMLAEAEEEEDCDEMGDDIKASVTDQDENMAEAGQPQAPVGDGKIDKALYDALKTLVYNATQEFGFIPRNVYSGVFDLPETTAQHDEGVKRLRYPELVSLVTAFSKTRDLHEFSHLVVVVWPHENPDDARTDLWDIDFKSTRIAEKVMKATVSKEERRIREIFDLLREIPESSTLAGRFFEVIVHRIFARGWQSDAESIPRPICMIPNEDDPPTFSTGPSTPGTSVSSCAPLRAEARVATQVDLAHELGNVTLEEGKHYILTSTTDPLFDSFTVDLVGPQTAVISIFRIAISQNHGGSADGYLAIRELITHVRKLLEKELLEREPPKKRRSRQKRLSVTVVVEYFLICSDKGDGSKQEWRMPAGWSMGLQGRVFCIRVP